jgi:hypothetical protein
MSNFSDSDGSDDDFLFQERIFAKPKSKKKQSLTPIKTLERILSGEPIVPNKDGTEKSTAQKRTQARRKQQQTSNNKKRKKSSKQAKSENNRKNDPEWVETQARKTVEEVLRLDVVDEVTDLNDIGWYRFAANKGKTTEYYPAIISQNKAEARMLLKSKTNRSYKTKKIQYIGVFWRYALKHEEIALSKWIPYSKSSDSENEEWLQNFVKTISKTSLFKDDPVSLKTEELAVRKVWEKVRVQKERRQLEEEKERAEVLLQPAGNSIDPSAAAVPPVSVTQDSDNNSQNSKGEEAADSDDDDDDYDDLSPRKNRTKRTSLRVNDEIEFYESIGTFGNPSSLLRATIVGIRPKDSSYPLILSNTTMPIPGTHRVRRLPDEFWQPINEFVLLQEGTQSLAGSGSGLNEATKRMRKINAEIVQARDDFWKNGHTDASEKDDKKTEVQDDNFGKEEKTKDNSISVVNEGDVPLRRIRRSSARIRSTAK